MATYGITVYLDGSDPSQDPNKQKGIAWQLAELQNLAVGAVDTATAFSNFQANAPGLPPPPTDPKALFKTIMDDFTVVHVVNGFQFADANGQIVPDGCDGTVNASCTSNDRGVILFYGTLYSNLEFTFVHEMGHRFDSQSNAPKTNGSILSLSERFDTNTIFDCGTPIPSATPLTQTPTPSLTPTPGPSQVPTNTPQPGIVAGAVSNNWERGERGWGSGPAKNTNNGPLITDYQQDPLFENQVVQGTPVSRQTAVSEGAADMFLNWVYRRLPIGAPPSSPCSEPYPGDWNGFLNRTWRNQTANAGTTGTPDNTLPGSKRYDWMNDQMLAIFQQHTW